MLLCGIFHLTECDLKNLLIRLLQLSEGTPHGFAVRNRVCGYPAAACVLVKVVAGVGLVIHCSEDICCRLDTDRRQAGWKCDALATLAGRAGQGWWTWTERGIVVRLHHIVRGGTSQLRNPCPQLQVGVCVDDSKGASHPSFASSRSSPVCSAGEFHACAHYVVVVLIRPLFKK